MRDSATSAIVVVGLVFIAGLVLILNALTDNVRRVTPIEYVRVEVPNQKAQSAQVAPTPSGT
jgi:hypothetical protein